MTIRAALAFDNRLSLIELTGDQMIAAMENSVSRAPALDGRFPQVANMQLEVDLTRPGLEGETSLEVPSRIRSLVITKADGSSDTLISDFSAQGDLRRTFTLATNSFLLTGGDGYAAFTVANLLGETDLGEQKLLEDYIVNTLGGLVEIDDPPPSPRVVLL